MSLLSCTVAAQYGSQWPVLPSQVPVTSHLKARLTSWGTRLTNISPLVHKPVCVVLEWCGGQKLRVAIEVLRLPGVQGSVCLNLAHPRATASSGTETTLPQLPPSLEVIRALCPREKVKVSLGFLHSSHLTPASPVGLPHETG